MWTRFADLDTDFSAFDELRRNLDRVWEELEPEAQTSWRASALWPRVNAYDAGQSFVLEADVPGMTEKDLKLTVDGSTVTLEGERAADAPEGFSAHRLERGGFKFSRSFKLPFKADAERCEATVKEGVLTVTLPKVKEAQPRQIAVRAS
jgi:HSP20 family protein